MADSSIPGPRVPVIERDGTMNPAWYRFFVRKEAQATEAAAGEILTPAAGGLEGGGLVSDGVELSIAEGGVTNDMIRDGLACSVIGRFMDSDGEVADIQAVADERVLSREGGLLAFRPWLNGISLGPDTPAPARVTTLRIDTAPTVSAATTTHKVQVNLNGATYYLLASNV